MKQTFFDDYDGTLVNHLLKLLGLSLIGEQIEHVLVLLFGFGRNGKGTLVELINFVLGSYARTIPSAMLLDRGQPINPDAPSPTIMGLQGARFAHAAETGKGRRFSVELLKNFTGNDTLTARRGYDRDDTNFKPSHTLFVQTNWLPKADPQDLGFWDRVHTIQFNARFTKEAPQEKNEFAMDVDLPKKLEAEASGILARLVQGCKLYQEEGIIKPKAVQDANKEYNLSVDHLAEFFGVCFTPERGMGLKVTPLYKAYLSWAEHAGVRPVGRDSFFDSVKRRQKISHETHGDGHSGLYSGLDVLPECEWQC